MATLEINGKRVEVDDSFMSLSPEQQNATVDEIAQSLGGGQPEAPAPARANPNYGFMDAVYDKLPFGDEVGALGAAAGKAVGRAIRGGEGSFGEDYQIAMEEARQNQEGYAAENPIMSGVAHGVSMLPTMAMAPGAKIAQGVAGGMRQGAIQGASTGALYGAGEGQGVDRIGNALTGGALGGAMGGALGAVGGAFNAPPSTPVLNAAEEAATRLGAQVPRAITTDSMLMQRAGQHIRNVPGAGEAMQRGIERGVQGLDDAAMRTARGLGNAAGPDEAGSVFRKGIENWIGTKSAAKVKAAYDEVDLLIDPNATGGQLANTMKATQEIASRRQAAGLGPSAAARLVEEALGRPNGLTYQGIKTLRSAVGEMLDNPSRLPADIGESELRRIYGALTNDLRETVAAVGNPGVLQRFNRANALNAAVARRREALDRLLGTRSDEQLARKVRTMAESGAAGDTALLLKARKAMDGDDWNDVVSTVVANLGRDANGQFSPARFLTDYGKLSEAGKRVLFRNPQSRQALDDIAKVSERYKDAAKFGNPSGTAQNVGFMTAGAGLLAAPITTISSLVGGNVMARILASPRSVQSMAQWAKAYDLAVRRPSRGAIGIAEQASRRFANQIGEQLGIEIDPMTLIPGQSPAGTSSPLQ